jgi:hypothetical protein
MSMIGLKTQWRIHSTDEFGFMKFSRIASLPE